MTRGKRLVVLVGQREALAITFADVKLMRLLALDIPVEAKWQNEVVSSALATGSFVPEIRLSPRTSGVRR
jgi:hypothetical protein